MQQGTYPIHTRWQAFKPGSVTIDGGEIVIKGKGMAGKRNRIPASQVTTVTMDESGMFFKKGIVTLHGAGGQLAVISGKLSLMTPIYQALNN